MVDGNDPSKPLKAGNKDRRGRLERVGWGAATHVVLGVTCALVFLLTTVIVGGLIPESSTSRTVGAIWAIVSTIFVFHDTADDRHRLLISRLAGTLLSCVLCGIYLLLLPFTVWGLAVVIAVGGILATLLRRPGDTGIVAITTTVILVVASLTPPDQAWLQPVLRLLDTILGAAIGFVVAAAWSVARRKLAPPPV